MTRTSPPRPLDLAGLFPGVEAFARTATRLHPRPGVTDVHASHVGGPLLWPVDEPWPTCAGPHQVREERLMPPELVRLVESGDSAAREELRRLAGGARMAKQTDAGVFAIVETTVTEPVPSPMLAVAQLRATDIPDLPTPDGADVLQVLWCPAEHEVARRYWGPAVQLRWRRQREVGKTLDTPPPPTVAPEEEYLPRPCVLHPERVVEYPWWQELPAELGVLVRAWEDERQLGEDTYFSTSQARGWKVGGYASWEVSDLIPMDCPECGVRMDLLLTAADGELEWEAWRPVEEAHLRPDRTDPEWRAANEPTGVRVGRDGILRIFVCLACPGTPHRLHCQ